MQGDLWKLPNGQQGIEIGKSGKVRLISVIDPHWPFPRPPIAFHVGELEKLPSRYHHGAIPEEFEDAMF